MTDSAPTEPALAVVTVTYSPGRYLAGFLDSLPAATSAPTRVILADNGSIDGAPQAAAERGGVELLEMGANLGYGAAINRAVAEVDPAAEFVVVANPDVVWGDGSIDELLAVARRHPRAGAVGPLVREPDGEVYPSARALPNLLGGAGHAVLSPVWPTNPFTRRYRAEERATGERQAGWLSGSCLLLRRAAFDSIGGFDSRYFMYFEDVDLGDRLARAGWQNVYAPSAEVVHARGHAASAHPELTLAAHHESAYRYLADRHPRAWQAPLRGVLRAGLAVRGRLAIRAALAEKARAGQAEKTGSTR